MTQSIEPALRAGAQEILGRRLTDEETARFGKYLELLVKWQKVQRLVGSTDPGSITDLVLDSLLFTSVLPPDIERLMDLGSGAGLPGIPLSIVAPAMQVTLVESRQKRASFLSTAVRELGLSATRVINSRAEALPPELHESFDAVVMRCAGPLDQMVPLAMRFVVPGGSIIATGPPEAEAAPNGIWTNVTRSGGGGARLFAVLRK